MNTDLIARIEQASKITGLSTDSIRKLFVSKDSINDDDLIQKIIELSTIEDIQSTIQLYHGIGTMPLVKLRAASIVLLGNTSIKPIPVRSDSSVLESLLQANRPIQQWSDEEVLRAYIDQDDDSYEFELNKRAKGRRFVILSDRNANIIDVDATLNMLKRARKEEIPEFIQTVDGQNIFIYRVEEYHKDNRARAESPLHPNVALFDDFCPVAKLSFANISDMDRAFIRLIVEKYGEANILRTEAYDIVTNSREKGYEWLKNRYPEVDKIFGELKYSNSLPSLIMVESMKSRTTKADPFKPSRGHRTF